MYCRYCGKEIPENSNFCPNCGKKQSENGPNGKPSLFQFFVKHKKNFVAYALWCLIHIGLLVFSSPGEGYEVFQGIGYDEPGSFQQKAIYSYHKKIDEFYPFDTSLSNIMQGGKFWCDPIENIKVYDFSELFFYTIFSPFLIWAFAKICPGILLLFRKCYHHVRKIAPSMKKSSKKSTGAIFYRNYIVNNTFKAKQYSSIKWKIILKVIVVLICFILLGIKACIGYSHEKKEAILTDTDCKEEVVDSVINRNEEYFDDYQQKLEQAVPAVVDSVEEVAGEGFEKIDNDQLGILKTGDMPYAKFYGKNLTCRRSECTGIKVTAPEASDVVVIIKKRNEHGKVAGHAYISAGDTYKIDLPDGTYQTFFYYGDEWSSYKDMGNGIKGGFVRDELFAKDNPQEIYGAVLSYVLQLRRDGNFHTKSSSRSEMF